MQAFPFDFDHEGQALHGLFVDRPQHVSCEVLADELYNQYRSDLSVASIVVIRPPVDRPLDPTSIALSELNPLFQRLPHIPLHVLGSWQFNHFLTPNLNPQLEGISEARLRVLLEELRRFELYHYALDANALLTTSGPRIFRAPSGKYCRSFIRVGSVQTHRVALDGFFFWLLPLLKDSQAIVTETWTISSIALNAGRLIGKYTETIQKQCEVDMLARYHDGSSELIPDTASVLRRAVANGDGKVLVLVSSTMSGTLIQRLRDTICRIGLNPSRFVFCALYNLGKDPGIHTLCDISNGINGRTFECFDQPPADAGTTPLIIDIDKRTYFPLRIEEREVFLRKPTAANGYEFFSKYRSSGLISVHRDAFLMNRQRLRHHAIYTDVVSIIDKSPFKETFEKRLAEIDACPALILTPPHQAGIELARRASGVLGVRFNHDVPSFHHLDLNSSKQRTEHEKELFNRICKLTAEDAILIIDDVSVTGRRLSRYQLSLRELGYGGRIHYLVGIARPQRLADWEQRVRRLRLRQPPLAAQHTVNFVEFVVLPDWEEDRCPWCRERDVYRGLLEMHRPLPIALVHRAHRLQRAQSAEPLIEDVFCTLAGQEPLRLTLNSIFSPEPASQADVFAAVASSLQQMRSDQENPEKLASEYPEVPVLSVENYLGAHFNDSAIRAAILRAAMRSELEHPKAEGELGRQRRAVEVVVSAANDVNNLTLEILLAIALHKMPRLELSTEHREILSAHNLDEIYDLMDSAANQNY